MSLIGSIVAFAMPLTSGTVVVLVVLVVVASAPEQAVATEEIDPFPPAIPDSCTTFPPFLAIMLFVKCTIVLIGAELLALLKTPFPLLFVEIFVAQPLFEAATTGRILIVSVRGVR